MSPRFVLEIEAWNSMDAVMRIANMARRAKLDYQEMHVVFNGSRVVNVTLVAEGEEFEAKWLAAKLERMPEVYSVSVRRAEPVMAEEALIA
jgi:acetolactate synthase II small subunit